MLIELLIYFPSLSCRLSVFNVYNQGRSEEFNLGPQTAILAISIHYARDGKTTEDEKRCINNTINISHSFRGVGKGGGKGNTSPRKFPC